LFNLFAVPVPFASIVSPFIGSQKTLTPRIDGALIMDYGRIAETLPELLLIPGGMYESGTGIGFGIRLIEPILQMCGCIDVVWADIVSTRDFDLYPIPAIHMYTNLPF
jgi:hypothetical protein